MKCTNCRFDNPIGASYCRRCGGPLRRKKAWIPSWIFSAFSAVWAKKWLIIGVVCAFALLLGGGWGLIRFLQGPDLVERKEGFHVFQDNSQDINYFVTSDGKISTFDPGDSVSFRRQTSNLKGTMDAIAFWNWSMPDGYSLYLRGKDGVISLSDSVTYYCVAANADAVAYLEDGYVYLYKDGQRKRIASDACSIDCVSPDGTAVGYSVQQDDGNMCGYYWNGSTVELGKNKQLFAISNGGKYIYYIRNSSGSQSFYAQKGKDEDNRIKLGNTLRNVYSNIDGEELLYSDGEHVYILQKAKEKTRIPINSEYASPCFSYMTTKDTSDSSMLNQSFFWIWSASAAKTFAGHYYSSGAGFFYLDDQFNVQMLSSKYEDYYITEDNKNVFLLDSQGAIKKLDQKANSVVLLEDEAESFAATSDGSKVFYLNSVGELYCIKGSQKPKLICDDLDTSKIGRWNVFKGKTLYYISDGELYSTTGDKGKKVGTFDGEVTSLFCDDFFIIVQSKDGSDEHYYFSTDGKEFQKVY